MRTKWYINEDLGVYPWTGTARERAEQFPGDVACRWGYLGYLSEEAANEAADTWADYLDGRISECEFEFGPHTDHARCAQMLDTMNGDDYDDGYADAYNREAEEMSLGRPLFPNEY